MFTMHVIASKVPWSVCMEVGYMYLACKVDVKNIRGKPSPIRALVVPVDIKVFCSSTSEVEVGLLLHLEASLSCNGRDVSLVGYLCDHPWDNVDSFVIETGEMYHCRFVVLLSDRGLEYFEERRKGGDAQLTLQYRYRLSFFSSKSSREEVKWSRSESDSFIVPQSEWVKRLREMEWSDVVLFEIPILPLKSCEKLVAALDLLRGAEGSLRGGDYKEVLANCSRALESAKQHFRTEGDGTKDFEALVSSVYLNEGNKVGSVNAFIKALTGVAQFGRHESAPAVHVSREEAELVYASTVAFFSLLGRKLVRD